MHSRRDQGPSTRVLEQILPGTEEVWVGVFESLSICSAMLPVDDKFEDAVAWFRPVPTVTSKLRGPSAHPHSFILSRSVKAKVTQKRMAAYSVEIP